MTPDKTNGPDRLASLREPVATDGAAVHQLIADCPPLDTNSLYCNLLQCSHFRHTSVVAEIEDAIVGAISGYLIPERPDTVFVWQVAVGSAARGQGLALRMLDHIVDRPVCRDVRFMETTITEDNAASWGLFRKFAEARGAELTHDVGFDRDAHFGGQHDTEMRVRIGPFASSGG
ncbi:diaminobutyrate acetyltransferase [Chromatocurvus halotolerans]|uniref:diaminobutyrate acetyltransferase n=1 Tax=Chromatocurvus halotolerans TaxID=1132028 RepID=UPI000E3C03A4|nr:diaminobutyrate acetyltransferase [Chromatocurvus halotolerans]